MSDKPGTTADETLTALEITGQIVEMSFAIRDTVRMQLAVIPEVARPIVARSLIRLLKAEFPDAT